MTTSEASPRDLVNDWLGEGTGYRSVEFWLPGEPVPCPRPRVTRNGIAYYPPRYNQWKKAAAEHVTEVHPLLEGPLAVAVAFHIPPFKTVVRAFPRYDIDNYLKSVLDLVTKTERVWNDDSQVVLSCALKVFATDEPGIGVYIREA